MITVEHPLVHESGVFFGLPEGEYHGALALSATGIKLLLQSPLDYFMRTTALNPDYQDATTDQMIYGTAAHYRTLFGRNAFYQRYAPSLSRDDCPDALQTNEEIRDAIIRAGGPLPKSAMRKAELIELLLRYDPRATIWENELRQHAEFHAGKQFLSQTTINHIEIAAAMIEKHPDLSRAFTGGEPEVSIFWTDETGIPCKARLDYLKPRIVVDLKTFSNPYGMPIDRAIARAMANYRYHIQAAWYLEAAQQIAKLREGRIEHYPDSAGYEPYLSGQSFLFVFQQQGIAPVARGMFFGPGLVMDIARQQIEQAKLLWARCWETYGTEPWVDTTEIGTFEDSDFPAYIGDG